MFKYPSVKPHSKILSVKYKSQFMEIFPKNERSVKREERYFKQQGNIEFFRRAENADIF